MLHRKYIYKSNNIRKKPSQSQQCNLRSLQTMAMQDFHQWNRRGDICQIFYLSNATQDIVGSMALPLVDAEK